MNMLTKEEFHTFVKDCVDNGILSVEEIAGACDAAIPTVKRWYSGENAPHPMMRHIVIKCMKEAAKEFF